MVVFVKNKHGEALMPCSERKARLLLREKKAKIIDYKPFTIQLLYGSYGYKQPTTVGIDLGARYIGFAMTSGENVLEKGEIELRQDVKGNLETKKIYRRSRRNRKTRYRKARFLNRTKSKKKGWLPPSLESRIQNTFRWIDKLTSLLPRTTLSIEVGKFDVQKMMNTEIKGAEYQEGQTRGYHDVRYYVLARDNYTCQVCKKKDDNILNTHHIIYRSEGGSNRADNLITVGTKCHTSENHKEGKILWKWMQEGKKTKQYKEPPFMNTLRKRTFERYPNAKITYGSVTTPKRKKLGLEKSHYNDAIAITGIDLIKKNTEDILMFKQVRKKKRSLHEATARKGRKEKNTTAKRNSKNTPKVGNFHLYDTVSIGGEIGFISGFSGKTQCYVKNIFGGYITTSPKYKMVGLKKLNRLSHNNNWVQQRTLPYAD